MQGLQIACHIHTIFFLCTSISSTCMQDRERKKVNDRKISPPVTKLEFIACPQMRADPAQGMIPIILVMHFSCHLFLGRDWHVSHKRLLLIPLISLHFFITPLETRKLHQQCIEVQLHDTARIHSQKKMRDMMWAGQQGEVKVLHFLYAVKNGP